MTEPATPPELPESETCWSTALRCERRLRRRFGLSYAARFGADITDELWSDVVLERAPRVFGLFDNCKSKRLERSVIVNLDGYFIGSMLWYAWKWIRSRAAGLGGAKTSAYYARQVRVLSLDAGAEEGREHHWDWLGVVVDDVRDQVDGIALEPESTETRALNTPQGTKSAAGLREVLGVGVNELDEFECWLIHQVVVWGFTFVELAPMVGVTPQTVGRWYRAAVKKVRVASGPTGDVD